MSTNQTENSDQQQPDDNSSDQRPVTHPASNRLSPEERAFLKREHERMLAEIRRSNPNVKIV